MTTIIKKNYPDKSSC